MVEAALRHTLAFRAIPGPTGVRPRAAIGQTLIGPRRLDVSDAGASGQEIIGSLSSVARPSVRRSLNPIAGTLQERQRLEQ